MTPPGRSALDGAIDQAIEPLDGGLGRAAQRLVQALGVEALVVAADAGAIVAHRRENAPER
jgi:hypothetical protein